MIKYVLPIWAILIAFNCHAQKTPLEFAKQIKLENIKKHTYTLASLEMQGRNTGEQGQKDAAKYISNYFRENGLDSLDKESYYQSFNLYENNVGRTKATFKNASKYKYHRNIISLWGTSFCNSSIKVKKVMAIYVAGFGTHVPDIDLSDKIVIVFVDENLDKTHKTIRSLHTNNKAQYFYVLFDEFGKWEYDFEKDSINNINSEGPIHCLNYKTQDYSFNIDRNQTNSIYDEINKSVGVDEPVLIKYGYKYLSRFIFNEKNIKKIFKQERKKPLSAQSALLIDSVNLNFDVHTPIFDSIATENVFAFIEGTEKKDEVIVVSAHYDHVGVKDDSIIRYGADDNASGTVAVMEIAAAMQKAANSDTKPKRSVIFIACSAEELGLFGSEFYVNNPIKPLSSTVFNFNLDMIGRNRDDKEKYNKTVFMYADGEHAKLTKQTIKKSNKGNKELKVSVHGGMRERKYWKYGSDHYNFYKNNIPVACFFTGMHPDYHKTSDTPDKINYEKLTEITRLTYKTIWEMANIDGNMKVEIKNIEK